MIVPADGVSYQEKSRIVIQKSHHVTSCRSVQHNLQASILKRKALQAQKRTEVITPAAILHLPYKIIRHSNSQPFNDVVRRSCRQVCLLKLPLRYCHLQVSELIPLPLHNITVLRPVVPQIDVLAGHLWVWTAQ